MAKWRNWQTHQTQNLAHFTVRVGSTPTFATTYSSLSPCAFRPENESCPRYLAKIQQVTPVGALARGCRTRNNSGLLCFAANRCILKAGGGYRKVLRAG